MHRVPAVPEASDACRRRSPKSSSGFQPSPPSRRASTDAPMPTSKTMSSIPDASSIKNSKCSAWKPCRASGIVLRRRAPDSECTLWVLHDDDALCLHVDHGLERIWQLSVPLGDLGPDGVAQLVLRVRCHRNFAVLAREQEPQDQPRFECGLPYAVAGPNRHAVVLPYCFEGLCLPRFWCRAENVPDEDQRIVLALEPRALPRRAH